jgi:hypothetical protein
MIHHHTTRSLHTHLRGDLPVPLARLLRWLLLAEDD